MINTNIYYNSQQNANNKKISKYIKLILANNKFTIEQKIELIQAKTSHSYPANN